MLLLCCRLLKFVRVLVAMDLPALGSVAPILVNADDQPAGTRTDSGHILSPLACSTRAAARRADRDESTATGGSVSRRTRQQRCHGGRPSMWFSSSPFASCTTCEEPPDRRSLSSAGEESIGKVR